MTDRFFDKPILNSPYEYPRLHWELDPSGQPTNKIEERRRRAEFITPIPKPKKQRRKKKGAEAQIVMDEGTGLSTEDQRYDPTPIINELRAKVDAWRELPRSHWQVTPETARLLEHWRSHQFGSIRPLIQVRVNGVDVFHPNTGEIRSDGPDGIACWFIDTGYDEESFFVRHAYFLGASDPYKALRTTVKAEINEEAWSSLYSNTSPPIRKPTSGRIAIKAINHQGDEVMKVFRVESITLRPAAST